MDIEVKNVMQSHIEVILREGIVWSLHGTMIDMAQYVGVQAPVSEIIKNYNSHMAPWHHEIF